MIEVTDLRAGYGKLVVLHGVNVTVEPGKIVAVLGPNGAGKTTLMKSIVGLIHPFSGKISFLGRAIQGFEANRVARHGVCLVPEGRGIFPEFTVAECLRMGLYALKNKAEEKHNYERVFATFPVLSERRQQTAGSLSGGEQQMLAIAIALMASPKLLLLDEPSLGLAPLLVREIYRIVKLLNGEGMTIMIADQNVKAVLGFADCGYVLESGRIVLAGECKQLAKDDRVRQSLLGEVVIAN